MYLHAFTQQCPDCYGFKLLEIGSDLTCASCGLVVEAGRLTFEPEWRSFADDHDPVDKSRVGFPVNTSFEKEQKAKTNVDDIFANITMPQSIIQDARHIAKSINYQYKGDDRKAAFVTACIYFAAKQNNGLGRSKEELCTQFKVNPKTFNKICTDIENELAVKFPNTNIGKGVKITDLMNRYISFLPLSQNHDMVELRRTVLKLYDKVKHIEGTVTLSPNTMVVTLIYMASMYLKKNITMKVIANSCGCSLTTIINTEAFLKDVLMKKK